MFELCFSKLIDFKRLMDPTWWVSPDGDPGESPFDMLFFMGDSARDILTRRLLQYFNFLNANMPWFNSTNCYVLDRVAGINSVH